MMADKYIPLPGRRQRFKNTSLVLCARSAAMSHFTFPVFSVDSKMFPVGRLDLAAGVRIEYSVGGFDSRTFIARSRQNAVTYRCPLAAACRAVRETGVLGGVFRRPWHLESFIAYGDSVTARAAALLSAGVTWSRLVELALLVVIARTAEHEGAGSKAFHGYSRFDVELLAD
jgi:hypothetical protein